VLVLWSTRCLISFDWLKRKRRNHQAKFGNTRERPVRSQLDFAGFA
jgi:hypothetical protein